MESVLKFLADLLTDQLDGVSIKSKALELYVELRMKKENPTSALTTNNLVFGLVNNPEGHTIHISPRDYEQVRDYVNLNQKINAIKHLRLSSLINGDKAFGCPGLKESKDFVEIHNWNKYPS